MTVDVTRRCLRMRNYASAVILHPEQAHPGFEPQISQFEEGFSLEFSDFPCAAISPGL